MPVIRDAFVSALQLYPDITFNNGPIGGACYTPFLTVFVTRTLTLNGETTRDYTKEQEVLMDPFKDFIDRTFTKEFNELTGARSDREDGKLSQNQMNALMRAYDLTASIANLGITAVNIFDTHVPIELQEAIKSAIEQVADARTKYRMGKIDVATLRATM